MNETSQSIEFAGKTLTFQSGRLAPQATAAVLARLGDTVVLVTVVEGAAREDIDYFPLSVEYQERLYAGGRIKGSRWVKREGRPSDEAVLIGRLIDRSIRPLFPKEYKNEVQVIVTVLSVDGEHEPDIIALNAVSAALAISPIPWKGPIGAIRMGLVRDPEKNTPEVIFNPTTTESLQSELDVVVSQLQEKTVMIEAGAFQVPEDLMHEAIVKAHSQTQKMIDAINELVGKVGQPKKEVAVNQTLQDAIALVEKSYKKEVKDLIPGRVSKESGSGEDVEVLVAKIMDEGKTGNPEFSLDKKNLGKAIEYVMYKIIRQETLKTKKRIDGRAIDEIRKLDVEVGVLPRTHGSAIFQRGLTQVLTVVTLGSSRMEQLIESAEGEEAKRYIHHYSGLPYSFGQTGRVGTPSRREIGHGALAERALMAVLPPKEKFPYTIRLVSEVLSQNGSSSMASTCGSTLALMDAGVPITKMVAGIVVGMMSEGDDYMLLTDIIGLEDFSGDMDFKVTGTDAGITAIQMDVKIAGLTDIQVKEILERAKQGRMFVLDKMMSVISTPREKISEYAPKIEMLRIPVEKIGELIGPGGKTIKNIIATTGAQVDVEDDGSVSISGINQDQVQHAVTWVQSLTREVRVGETFEGAEVKRILPFGAFVEILPGKEGMVHVSKMSDQFVKDPNDIVHIGDKVTVRVVEVDEQGRINLSMRPVGEDNAPRGPREDRGPREHRDFRGNDRNASTAPRHPLAMQFEREKRQKRSPYGPKRTYDR